MRRFAILGLVLACSCRPTVVDQSSGAPPVLADGVVERVVDGDTLVATIDGTRVRVRLIGVDTPETVKPGAPVQCYGREASAFAKGRLQGRTVGFEYDVDRLDRYGRTLAYVHDDAGIFNIVLVEQGYATVLTIPPNVAHVDELIAAQRRAREAERGLWGACPASD